MTQKSNRYRPSKSIGRRSNFYNSGFLPIWNDSIDTILENVQ